MSDWLKSIIGYMLIVSVTMQLIPDKKYEQYVRLFTGFLLIVIVLQPILRIRSANSYIENKIAEFVQEQESLEEQILAQGEAFAEESKALQESEEEGIDSREIEQIQVEVKMDD